MLNKNNVSFVQFFKSMAVDINYSAATTRGVWSKRQNSIAPGIHETDKKSKWWRNRHGRKNDYTTIVSKYSLSQEKWQMTTLTVMLKFTFLD